MNLGATPRFLAFALCMLGCSATLPAQAEPASSIPAAALITPGNLAARLGNGNAAKPLILQVGFRTLFDQAHIPGAKFAGPAGQSSGLKLLQQSVAALPHDAD